MTTRTEFTSALETLKGSAESLLRAAEALLAIAKGENEGNAPEPSKVISLVEVRALLAEKSRQGYTDGVRAIITARGADRLSDIDPSEYEAVMKEAETLGDG